MSSGFGLARPRIAAGCTNFLEPASAVFPGLRSRISGADGLQVVGVQPSSTSEAVRGRPLIGRRTGATA
jgi:hypothetical protein